MLLRRTQLYAAALLLPTLILHGSEASLSHEEGVLDALHETRAFGKIEGSIRGLLSSLGTKSLEPTQKKRELSDIFAHLDYDGDGVPPTNNPTCTPTPPTGTPTPSTPTPPTPTPSTPTPSTPTPSLAPAPEPQSSSVTCPQADESGNTNVQTVDVNFKYNLETNVTDPGEAEPTIARLVERVLVGLLADSNCGEIITRRQLRRMTEVLAVSTVHEDRCDGTCTPTADDSLSCTKCKGVISMEYDDTGTGNDAAVVTEKALESIKASLADTSFVPYVNSLQSTGVDATAIIYTGPTSQVVAASDKGVVGAQQGETSITPGGKAVIALLAFFFFCLMLIVCCIWRARRQSNAAGDADRDSKSLLTKDSSQDDNSYMTTDFHDLARPHSKLDVHECNSATCRACNPPFGLQDIAEASYRTPDEAASMDRSFDSQGVKFVKTEGEAGSLPTASLMDLDISVDPANPEESDSEDAEEEKQMPEEVAMGVGAAEEKPENDDDDDDDEHVMDLGLTEDDLEMAELNQEVTLEDKLDLTQEKEEEEQAAEKPPSRRRRGGFRFGRKKDKAETIENKAETVEL